MERIRRRNYILASIIIGLVQVYIYHLMNISHGKGDDFFFLIVAFILMTITSLILARGRLQDTNRNGSMALLLLIPLVNLVVMIPLIFRDGTIGPNKYGWDPKLRKRPIPKHWATVFPNIKIEKLEEC
jgi:uncharacterized membrane protein YhaH (DUF805 family)